MSGASSPGQANASRGGGYKSAAIVGLVLVAVLALAFAGYSALNPYTVTVTQPEMVTNTQNLYSVQLQTATIGSTTTSITTVTSLQPNGYGYGGFQACGYYNYNGCYQPPGYYYNNPGYYYGYGYYSDYPACQFTGTANNVTCSGYLYQTSNGCTLLAVPTTNNPYPSYATTYVYEYYSLHNLPSNTPPTGTWVTVSGQLYQGYNAAANGASCPTSFIVVNSIS